MAQIAAGGALLLGLYFTWRRVEISQQTLETQQDQQVTERFTRAIDQLGAIDEAGKPKLEIRIGGIYALERIARDSPTRDYATVMEVLTAYVRENSRFLSEPIGWRRLDSPTGERRVVRVEAAEREEPMSLLPPRADIQAILNVLGRREEDRVPQQFRVALNLQKSDLSGVDLAGANLARADLSGSNLSGAILTGANLSAAKLPEAKLFEALLDSVNLSKAFIYGANLTKAVLVEADLSKANLWRADLRGAYMPRANLSGASLYEANLAKLDIFRRDGDSRYLAHTKTVLSGANLSGADLTKANLSTAELTGTNFRESNLSGTDLTAVLDASQEQIEHAMGDTTTKLPEGITLPASWRAQEQVREDE